MSRADAGVGVTLDGAAPRFHAATTSDAEAIAVFQTECWREAYAGLVPQAYLDRVGVDERAARWRDRLVSGTRQVVIAEVNGVITGTVSWANEETTDVPPLELKSLYVAATHRGTGLAAALLALSIGTAPAHLWVFEGNFRAQRFYGKHGFRLDTRREVDPDTGVAVARMVRPA